MPALSREGPKAAGKTETALRRAKTVYRLDEATQRSIVEADSERLLRGKQPLDEVQVLGRGGTVLMPGIRLLETTEGFPQEWTDPHYHRRPLR